MEWIWVVGGAAMLLPIVVINVSKPFETRVKTLEAIELVR